MTPLVFKDELAVPNPLSTFAEMAVIDANIARLAESRIFLRLIIDGHDSVRRTWSDYDFIKDQPLFDEELNYIGFGNEVRAIRHSKYQGRLLMKGVLVATPCLSDYPGEYQTIIHCMTGITWLLGLPFILTGTDILAIKSIVPSGISRVAMWRFLVSLGHALYSIGVSHFVTVSQSDLLDTTSMSGGSGW